MTVTYHSGERIQGTQADFDGIPAISGGWKEVGRTTLGSANQFIDIESLPDKRYYMILLDSHGQSSTDGTIRVRYNNTGNSDFEYAGRYALNGTEGTYVNELSNFIGFHSEDTSPKFRVAYISNKSDKEKLTIGHSIEQSTAGAGNAPNRAEDAEKWVNTTDAISSIEHSTGATTNTWNTNSEVVVLGYDPDDTHTDNFWEQLASVEGDGTSTTISSGTIAAKKYLWVQAFTNASSQNTGFQFNNDTGNNYTIRRSSNGTTDATETSIGYIEGSDTSKAFTNMFIINNSDKEKLTIGHSIHNPTAGAGTAPTRNEVVGKWVPTTNQQITEIDYMQQTTSVNFPSGSILKVWGHD